MARIRMGKTGEVIGRWGSVREGIVRRRGKKAVPNV